MLVLRPRVERWNHDWMRARYVQDLPHLRPDTVIGPDAWIIGGEHIHFGEAVRLGRRARLQTVRTEADDPSTARIEIGDRVSAEDDCHIGAVGRVVIEADVLIASHVLILDHGHDYTDAHRPVATQGLVGAGLTIGAGSHIGEGACVLGPLNLGRHCVIGAGAVVVDDVPDLTVVAGVPARVIKRYDSTSATWRRV